MYATIRSYASDRGVDALVERQSEVRDLLTGINGFHAYYILRTPDGGAVSVSVYADAAGTATPTLPRRAGCATTSPTSPRVVRRRRPQARWQCRSDRRSGR